MEFNIPERLALLNVLPQEGSIITLRIVRELQMKLSFTEKEIKRYGIKNRMLQDGSATITWNPNYTEEKKEIEIGEATKGVIKKQLMNLESQGRLHISMMPLYERFVEVGDKG